MAKYGKKIVEKIVGLVKSDTFTIAEICITNGLMIIPTLPPLLNKQRMSECNSLCRKPRNHC